MTVATRTSAALYDVFITVAQKLAEVDHGETSEEDLLGELDADVGEILEAWEHHRAARQSDDPLLVSFQALELRAALSDALGRATEFGRRQKQRPPV